jgi:pimeloyl-ACP methyl ester carboxylesterase
MMQVGPHVLDVLQAGPEHADTLPLLLIHGINPIDPAAPFLNALSRRRRVIAPSHPGFGASPRPGDFDTMYDLVNLYLEVLDTVPHSRIAVAGFSFGGWIAAELAVAGHPKLDRLILVDPVGIKLGGREDRDITHMFNTHPETLNRLSWYDPAKRPSGIYGLGWQATIDDSMTDAAMISLARNWDSLCLYAWTPHMFNPQLKHWLHRIRVSTLVVWGDSDGIVTPDYGRRYAQLIPDAEFVAITRAGHHPELEQPAAFVARTEAFLDGRCS